MVETNNATDGESEDYPDPAAYQGCQEARETRRACFDWRCDVRETCQLWTDRDAPGYAVKALTWRSHWLCFDAPCAYHKPVGANHG